MSRAGIEQLLYAMDAAFDGDPWQQQSLLKNLSSVRDEDWLWVPDGCVRSIFDIVEHLGNKYTYDNHAFGDGSMRWDVPGSIPTIQKNTRRADVIAYLREGHRRWRANIEALADDEELMRPRKAPWGMETATRWLINVMIQHDLYHAGEINYLRTLRQRNDG